jgi:integrase
MNCGTSVTTDHLSIATGDSWVPIAAASHPYKEVQTLAETGKIGLWLRAMFEVGYTYGWRHEELLDLQVRQVNISAGTIRLEPGTTKNDQGREVSMTLPVKALLSQCVHGKTADDYVFTREDGDSVRDFRGSWAKVCEASRVPDLLLSRSAKDSRAKSAKGWRRRRRDYENRRLENSERVRALQHRFARRHSRRDDELRGEAAA